jgi:site-specific DNA recombinase
LRRILRGDRGDMVRALLYTRVSTDDQVKRYSLAQQREALRGYCESRGIEVLDEISDDGYSGAYLERPGLDKVRDLVEAGGVDLVLVQDRDRFSREPAYYFLLSEEFRLRGVTVRALNQRGDDSPEGQLTDGIIDQIAKFERAKTAERTRRGRLRKAKEGKIVGNGKINYGFRFVNDSYEVNPEEMEVASRIFHMLHQGKTVYEVATMLKNEGIRSPQRQAVAQVQHKALRLPGRVQGPHR